MRPEIRDAIENARGLRSDGSLRYHGAQEQRRISFGIIRAIVLAVVRELPEEITLAELRDELEIRSNQGGEE